MKREYIALLLILFLATTSSITAPDEIRRLFSLPEGNIAYVEGTPVLSGDYKSAREIKAKLKEKGSFLYSLLIADILPNEGNEIIAVYNDGRESFSVFTTMGEKIFSYGASYNPVNSKSSIDIKKFSDSKGSLSVIYFYVMNNKSQLERESDLYMFQVRKGMLTYITKILYFSERKGERGFVRLLKNTFADIDADGVLELVIEQQEKTERSSRIEYQLYEYDKYYKEYRFATADDFATPSYNFKAYFN